MATITQLTYTGDVKVITASSSSFVNFILAGGGGGGGGNDSRIGSAGTNSDIIRGKVFLNAGESLYCAVGAGGMPGVSGGSAGGGLGGLGLDGFSGGTGGNSGPGGWSGSGGGGGAATVLWKQVNGNRDYVAIAAGGGGGGGGGHRSVGYIKSPYDPFGSVAKNDLYYPQGGTNSSWSNLLNTHSVWNGNGNYTYDFYFPVSGTYVFNLSIDNYGILYVDNAEILKTTQDSNPANYNSFVTTTKYIEAGWKTIKIYGVNTGGPASVAATIGLTNGTIVWTTRNSYNQRDALLSAGRGGKGQNHQGDGGGPGGGGGGLLGGVGSETPIADVGAPSGSNGYSFIAAGADLDNSEYEAYVDSYSDLRNSYASQSLLSKADWGRKHYRQYGFREGRIITNNFTSDISQYALFGLGYGAGSPGLSGAAVFYSVQADLSVYDGGVWKQVKEAKYYNNGAWVDIYEVYNRVSNDWKRVYGNNIPTLTTTSGTFNNTTGSMIPYAPPPETVYIGGSIQLPETGSWYGLT